MVNDEGRNRLTAEQEMDAIGQFGSSSELDRKKKTPPASPPRRRSEPNVIIKSDSAITTETSEDHATDTIEIGQPFTLKDAAVQEKTASTTMNKNEANEDEASTRDRHNKKGNVVKIEALEIDMESPKALHDVEIGEDEYEDDDDDDDDEIARDMERLLTQTSSSKRAAANNTNPTAAASSKNKSSSSSCSYCCFGTQQQQQQIKRRRIGNTSIVFPGLYQRTGWGMVGPHWFGPPSVLLLLLLASSFFIYRSTEIGPITTMICVGFTIATAYNLMNAAFRDPGIVFAEDQQSLDLSNYRWCEFCNVYQPPDGAHCRDCNVCVAGYDHHCVCKYEKKRLKELY
jgi:hypothetical protein